MLTFDNKVQLGDGSLEDMFQSNLPDAIEVGETNDYWLHARRSTKLIELTSKQTGSLFAKCSPDDAALYGLTKAQISAAKSVLKL